MSLSPLLARSADVTAIAEAAAEAAIDELVVAAEDVTVDSTTLVGTGADVQAVLEELDNAIAGLGAIYALLSHAHAGTDITSGTIDIARLPSTLATDVEVAAAVAAEVVLRDAAIAAAINGLIASAPGLLDTLDEIAAALGDDPAFATTITTALAGKIAKTTLDANSVLYATADDTPAALSMGASTTLARLASGDIIAATPTQMRTLYGLVISTDIQAYSARLATIAGLSVAADDRFMIVAGGDWAVRTPAQAKTSLALVKGDVGLGNVDNVADASKPISTLTQAALDLKADLASPTFTGNPVVPTQTAGNNSARAASTAYVRAAAALAAYRTILQAGGSHVAGRVAGTYALGYGDPLAVSGTGTLYPLAVVYLDDADYPAANGLSPKLRIRAQLAVNDVAPTGNFTVGLYPITRPGTSGGAGLNIFTLGTVVSGSTVAQNTPAVDSHNTLTGSDFAFPADGFYVIGVVTTQTVAASSHVHLNAQLQLHHA